MGSALLNTQAEPELAGQGTNSAEAAARPDAEDAWRTRAASAEALRVQVAERVAAHRKRRPGAPIATASMASEGAPTGAVTRSARIAAAVAERYARTPSYRAFLAAEAERAIQQARAAAEVAAMNAQAVATAQQSLLDAFDQAAGDQIEIPESEEVLAQEAHRGEYDAIGEVLQAASSFPVAGPGELNLWTELDADADADDSRPALLAQRARPRRAASEPRTSNPAARSESQAANPPAFTVRLYEDSLSGAHVDLAASRRASSGVGKRLPDQRYSDQRSEAEARVLDEEIAFRRAPVFEEPAGPPVPLPANLIEFPRQLVAPRKARPRYAEGPLREESEAALGDGQLRIFEVDVAQISTQPDAGEESTAQWTSIWLDTPHIPQANAPMQAGAEREHGLETLADPVGSVAASLQPARMGRRVTASAVNAVIVLTGLLAFAATFVAVTNRSVALHSGLGLGQTLSQLVDSVPAQTGLQPASIALGIAIVGVLLYLVYQTLFFWFSETTPGMRCARIALCTFDDENPTRRAIRWRMVAVLISALPLGLGFLWSTLDEDRLTWHDRISRMYLRSY
jgi:hypothetical protein